MEGLSVLTKSLYCHSICPLTTNELKQRRIGGRDQISHGGQHLCDGVPFGRPQLRATTNRPEIHIPPRKRRRLLTSSDDEGDNEDAEDNQMLLLTNGEDDMDDTDFAPVAEEADRPSSSDSGSSSHEMEIGEDEDLDDELQHLVRDNAEVDEAMEDANLASDHPNHSEQSAGPSGQITLEALDNIGALRAAFPAASIDLCERVLTANHNDLRLAYVNLKEAFDPALPESAVLSGNLYNTRSRSAPQAVVPPTAAGEQDTRKNSTNEDSVDDAADDEDASGSDSDAEDVPDLVRRYDTRGLPPGTISTGHGLATMAAGTVVGADGQEMPRPTRIVFEDEDEDHAADAADTSSSEDLSSRSEPDTSSDEDDDSDSDSEDGDSGAPKSVAPPDQDMADEDSDSDDSSFDGGSEGDSSSAASSNGDDDGSDSESSDSGPEETTTKQVVAAPQGKTLARSTSSNVGSSDSSDSDSDDSSDDSSSDEEAPASQTGAKPKSTSLGQAQPPVAPGQGKLATKVRNARRRTAKRLRQQAQTNIEAGPESQAATGDPTLQTTDEKAAFEARRQALLDALASGGIELGPGGSSNLEQTNKTTSTSKRKRVEEQEQSEGPQQQNVDTDQRANPTAVPQAPTPDSQQRRQRFNLDTGKRLLFGALGLRAPKTADDAAKMRTKLMKDVRPLVNARLVEDSQKKDAASSQPDEQTGEDPDAWREKISLRAVECCQEGITLSEPPFPFVQRWDPQQQGLWNGKKNKRGGKGKKADRNQSHYYEEDNRGSKKRKHDDTEVDETFYDDTTFNGVADVADDNAVLNYDDPKPDAGDKNHQGEASQFTDIDDLPSLPGDLSALPSLVAPDARVGMVITWKKLSCSAATKWQPVVSDVTAVVIRVEDEGATLEVCLARRDRDLDAVEKRYDEITGQRLYDKFEAPDIDDDEDDSGAFEQEQEDDGYRTLEFTEMAEPRIVQQPNVDEMGDTPGAEQTNGNIQSDPALGLIPSTEQSSGQASALVGPSASFMTTNSKKGKDSDINTDVPAQSGKSSMLSFGNSSSNATSSQAGQGQQASDLTDRGLLREHHSPPGSQPSVDIALVNQPLEDPSGYEGDLDTQMMDNNNSVVHETQPDTGSSEHTPTPFHDAMSNASNGDENVQMFEDDEVIAGIPQATRPRLMEQSPMSSVASGRQPDPTITNEMMETDTFKGTSMGGTEVAKSPSCLRGYEGDDPFVSDGEIPRKSSAHVSRVAKDAAYEKVIRELDGSPEPSLAGDQDRNPGGARTSRIIKTETTDAQRAALQDEDSLPLTKLKVASLIRSSSLNAPISPPAMRGARKSTGTTPVSTDKFGSSNRKKKKNPIFSIPSGSQVVDLLSSSDVEDHQSVMDTSEAARTEDGSDKEEDEPVFLENSADDDKDANYDPRAPDRSVMDLLRRGPGSARKVSHFKGTSAKKQKYPQRASTVDASPAPSSTRRANRLTASQPDVDGVIVLDSQNSTSHSPPASAPVQSAFSAFKEGRKLGRSGGQGAGSGSSGGSNSSSTAKKSWSAGASSAGPGKSAAVVAASRF